MSTDIRPADLPHRIVVDQHGHYWLDWGDYLSMPPASDENVETEIVAAYVLPSNPAPVVEARERIYSVLHAHSCDEEPQGHDWQEHLPWDEPTDEADAAALADALIAALSAHATPELDTLANDEGWLRLIALALRAPSLDPLEGWKVLQRAIRTYAQAGDTEREEQG